MRNLYTQFFQRCAAETSTTRTADAWAQMPSSWMWLMDVTEGNEHYVGILCVRRGKARKTVALDEELKTAWSPL